MPSFKFNVESCFGADIFVGYFNVDEILDIMGIKKEVMKSKRVKNLISMHGRDDRIVPIAKRQVAFDVLSSYLDSSFMPFDSYYVNDDKLLTSRSDRLYDAEERFLILCMSLVYGKSVKGLKVLYPDLSTKELRSKKSKGKSLFRYFREELNDQTRDYIQTYKERLKNADDKPAGREPVKEEAAPPAENVKEEVAETVVAAKPKKPVVETKLIPTSFEVETPAALKLFKNGHILISAQIDRMKRGEPIELAELKVFCQRLIESHTRNNFSLLAIRHIKDASSYLEQHAMGMAVLGIHFAKALKLSKSYIEVIALGALLFDLGRFRLPMAMVMKTEKMTDSEFDLFRKHIQFGEQILQKVEGVPKAVFQMLYDHHEKVDGSGYPEGKQGKEISVYGKIAAIIDAYDAITSEQAHKPSIGPIRACQRMRKESGLAFDKELIGVFLKNIGVIPVGSCVLLSNGRVGFVLTLNKSFRPSLVRQVYSMTNKSFIEPSDIELNKSAGVNADVTVTKEVSPQSLKLQFLDHIL
ncbi:HD domain-containing protein [Marinomonas sp. C2222]|uniref:HD domain-containing protein n=1 Tax=Marinomonas sargassi TaxID=2984494 RepID=A0ABT2YNN2_9GAMM|nr:HD domain-containing phosphohydrolase [Marinomonas sargassi]MCV2401499.1 HD domain-containing protein [Marinomonas sargassi]